MEKLINKKPQELTANMIWGKVIAYLREKKHIALHIACGDIIDVEKIDNDFIIYPKEKYLLDIINDENNYQTLQIAFANVGINERLNIKIIKQQTEADKISEDLQTLNKFVGDKIEIKGE